MQRAATSLILTDPLNLFPEAQVRPAHAASYHRFRTKLVRGLNSKRLFIDLGDRLVALAEQAYSLRQLDKLEDLSQALIALPVPRQYKSAARYFRGVELIRRGELDAAKSVLEAVAADPPHRYTARAIQSLGAVFKLRGDLESAMKLHIDAGRRAAEKGSSDLLTALFVQRNLAVIKSMQGDHPGALADLERMSPFARAFGSIHPPVFYDHLNSLAVEFGELGRLEEAARASRIAISSPFAVAYPEWRQTFDEIASRKLQTVSRSAVAVREHVGNIRPVEERAGATGNLLRLPLVRRPTSAEMADQRPQDMRARVLNFQHWKTAINASNRATPEGVTSEQRSRMATGEKLIRIMDLISQDETDDETIDRILGAVEEIVLKRRGKKLD